MAESNFEEKLKSFLIGDESKGMGQVATYTNTMLSTVLDMLSPFHQIQTESEKLVRALGLSSESIMGLAQRTVAVNQKLQLSSNYALSSEEILRMQASIMNGLERNVAIDYYGTVRKNAKGEDVYENIEDSTIENLTAAASVVSPETVTELVVGFDKLGLSMKEAGGAVGELFREAGDNGINLQKYSKNFISNLNMAQTYTFRNGVDGLREMARKATEVRQNMDQTAKFAEKVGTVAGAIETAAKLQVLGGPFTSIANPLAMLNESMTDLESLQQRILNMTKGAARYDRSRHQIRMNPLEKYRLRAAAEAAGLDPTNLIEQAFSQARIKEIENQMTGLGGMSEAVRNLIKNVGQIDSKTGLAGATIEGKFRTLGDIARSKDLQEKLKAENISEQDNRKNIMSIAKSVLAIERKVAGTKSQIRNASAANLVTEGPLGGATAWGQLTNLLIDGFDPTFLEAMRRADFLSGNVHKVLMGTVQNTLANAFKSFGTDNLDEFIAQFESTWQSIVGDSETYSNIPDWMRNIIAGFKDIVNEVGAFAKENGNIDLSSVYNTLDKNVPKPKGGNPEYKSVVLKSTSNAEHPVNVSSRSTVINATKVITGNERSVPGARVSAPSTEMSPRLLSHEELKIKFEVDGSLKFEGDKGRIGVEDIEKLLPEALLKSSTLRNDLMATVYAAVTDYLDKHPGLSQFAPKS